MSDEIEIACPACEYERNSQGKPVEKNGEMQCLDCGSTWRVFGTRQKNSSEKNKSNKPRNRARELASQVIFEQNLPPEPSVKISPKNYKLGIGSVMSIAAVCVLFFGVYFGFQMITQGTKTAHPDRLYIADVKVEEQVRRSGDKVFTVKGLVSNPTKTAKPIPQITIILRQTNGDEITRWSYNSSLASLKSGGKSYFASSIQYDTPIVAYAEAVFKK